MEGTFHRRELKSPSVSFSSPEGKEILKLALNEGHLEGYFHLAEHYITQGHPAFCGVGSLTMALNSLLLDPKRVWQGVWRWFDESMLDCCEPLDIIKMKGITLPKLSCLARCNGASSTLKYGTEITLEEFRADVLLISTAPPPSSTTTTKSCSHQACQSAADTPSNTPYDAKSQCEQATLKAAGSTGANRTVRNVMIASYCRGDLGQTGTGHFSPIGGYCAEKDMVLIMDVARFKYPPHWVPLPLLFHAMQRVDEETGKCRGYLLLSGLPEMTHKCECAALCTPAEPNISTTSTASNTTSTRIDVVTSDISAVDAVSVDVVSDSLTTRCVGTVDGTNTTTSPATRLHSLLEHSCPNCKNK